MTSFKSLGKTICLDMETAMAPLSFQGRDHVRLLQLLSDAGELWYDLQTFTEPDWQELTVLLEDPSITWVGQNIGFDYRCLLGCGITLRGTAGGHPCSVGAVEQWPAKHLQLP